MWKVAFDDEQSQVESLLKRFADGQISRDEFADKAGCLDIDILNRPVQVAVIALLGDESEGSGTIHTIINICRQYIDEEEGLTFPDGKGNIVIIFFHDLLWEEQIKKILYNIKKKTYQKKPGVPIIITLGNLVDDSLDLACAYKCSLGLMNYKIVKPKGKIIVYSDIINRRKTYPKGIEFRFDTLKELLINKNYSHTEEYIANIYGILSKDEMSIPGLAYNITFEIIINGISAVEEYGAKPEDVLDDPENLLYSVLAFESLAELKEWLIDFLKRCMNKIN